MQHGNFISFFFFNTTDFVAYQLCSFLAVLLIILKIEKLKLANLFRQTKAIIKGELDYPKFPVSFMACCLCNINFAVSSSTSSCTSVPYKDRLRKHQQTTNHTTPESLIMKYGELFTVAVKSLWPVCISRPRMCSNYYLLFSNKKIWIGLGITAMGIWNVDNR